MLDSSAAVEWLLGRPASSEVAARFADPDLAVHAPTLLGVEVASALRRLVLGGHMPAGRGAIALDDLRATDICFHDPLPLLPRAWELRANLSASDAVYVALAEALGATLVTGDARIARAPGTSIAVDVVPIG